MGEVYWTGEVEKTCQLCKEPIVDVFIDGKTLMGPWAIMCPRCSNRHGVGLGTGRGQLYNLQSDLRWKKVLG